MGLLSLLSFLPRLAQAGWFGNKDSDVPTVPPGRDFKWDLGPKDSRIEQEFIVKEYRFYDFSIGFGSPVAWDDKEHQDWRKDQRVVEILDTVEISINVKVQKIDETGSVSTVTDQVGNARPKFNGGNVVTRSFSHVKLRPGKYRVTATTLQETALPESVGTYLHIGFYPKANKLKDNE